MRVVLKRPRPGSWMVGRRGEGDRVASVTRSAHAFHFIFENGSSHSFLFRIAVDSRISLVFPARDHVGSEVCKCGERKAICLRWRR